MKMNHILYLVFPFVVGLVIDKFFHTEDTSIWLYIWLGCVASFFILTKIILPSQERKYNAISDIDIKSAYEQKMREQKPYSYITGVHMLLFFAITIIYFIN